MRIGIVCPSTFEAKALKHSRLRTKDVAFIVSGMGKLRAAYACGKLKIDHPKLRWVLLVGFAGGLTPNLKIGDIVEPEWFIEQDYDARPLEKFPNSLKRRARKLLRASIAVSMLTQDRFLTENPYSKNKSLRKYKSLACDMESYGVALFCRKLKLNLSVVKLISDCADKTADHDFLKACRILSPKLKITVDAAIQEIKRRVL